MRNENNTNLTAANASASVQLPTQQALPSQANQQMQSQTLTTRTQDWNISVPPREICESPNQILLLTIGGITIHGYWFGECGQYYSGWAIIPEDHFNMGIS